LLLLAHGESKKSIAGAVKNGAGSVAAGAGKAKGFVVAKSRASFDKAYAAKRPLAVAKLARLREENKAASPEEIVKLLETELSATEVKSGAESAVFTAAASLFIFTVIEIHGDARVTPARQRLIDSIIFADSKVTKNVAKYGGFALSLLTKRFQVIGKAVAVVAVTRGKFPWLKRVASIIGVEKAAKKGAAWIVITATRKSLGPAPADWPVAKAPSNKEVN
jgi:hypothetical protein